MNLLEGNFKFSNLRILPGSVVTPLRRGKMFMMGTVVHHANRFFFCQRKNFENRHRLTVTKVVIKNKVSCFLRLSAVVDSTSVVTVPTVFAESASYGISDGIRKSNLATKPSQQLCISRPMTVERAANRYMTSQFVETR